MRQLAIKAAIAVFFLLALVGAVSGVGPFVCGLRSVGAAAGVFVIILVAGPVARDLLGGPAARTSQDQTEEPFGEHKNQ